MKILAFDSSTSVSSVAFVNTQGKESEILFRSDVAHRRSDSSTLFEGLQTAVSTCGLPDALCVGLGPGSYNGLRAAIATARAFATALELPLYALPSPLALPGPDSGFWAVGDARGGHYWISCIRWGTFLQEPQLLSPNEIVQALQAHPDFPLLCATPLAGLENLTLATPDAGRLAILAEKADPCEATPEPLYLKPPHITIPRTVSA
jgi:tRNA threonylcarbamoyladenosine biosynthesis protein TsaB